MSYVPTHGPSCYKVRTFPTKCQFCNEKVIYSECTCGSKVFLDPPDKGEHGCGGYSSGFSYDDRQQRATIMLSAIAMAKNDPTESPQCPMCDVIIHKQQDFVKHLKRCPKRKEWFPLTI